MTTLANGRSPAPTDETGALDFSERPARPSNSATIHLAYQGVPVDLQISDKKITDIETLITGLLKRGWTAPPRSTGGFGKDNRVEAERDAQGREICPVHKTEVREFTTHDGRKFKGCVSKGTGQGYNPKGYCEIRFR